jgi:hypothetical protein
VHASGTKDEAAHEVSLWFKPEEIHDYPSVHEVHTLQYKAADIKKMRSHMQSNSNGSAEEEEAPVSEEDAQGANGGEAK